MSIADRVREAARSAANGPLADARQRPVFPRFWQELRERAFPFVIVNRFLRPAVFHQVNADYNSGVRMVVETLASLAHRRVAYISGHPAVLPIRQRLAAFRRYARKAGFEHEPALFESSDLNYTGGYDACRRLWAAVRTKPTAIVAFSDTVAVGVLRFLREQNVAVPGDVSLAGFDGTAVSEITYPSLSTVATPMYDIGKQAFELLLGAAEGKYIVPQDLNLPVRLMLRESVGPARAERKIGAKSGQ